MSSGLKFIIDPVKETAWETGCVLTGYTFSLKEDCWLLTIKVKDTKGSHRVAFIQAPTIAACYEVWYSAMTTTSITLKWREDKYRTS